MPNENEEEIVEETEETTQEADTEDTSEEPKAQKPKETLEAKKARLERQLKQTRKQMGETDDEPAPSKKSGDLDYGQKAYLTATMNIRGSEEWALVKEYVGNGKSIDDLVDNRHFNNDLKDLREAKASKDALPSGTKRSGQSARDDVSYWIAKGELPPHDQVELRRAVVNARMKAEGNDNAFVPSGKLIIK